MSSTNDSVPSRSDLLRQGGLYPIPIPHTWKLIGSQGEDIAIPPVAGHPFHRILARGALLAMEKEPTGPAEAMTLRQIALPSELSATLLQSYVLQVVESLAQQGLAPRVLDQRVAICRLSATPAAKVVLERNHPRDDRLELRYLVRDQTGQGWELVYLLRRGNLDAWGPLLSEIDTEG